MNAFSRAHLSDGVLLRDFIALDDRDRTTTADLLAHLAEVEARRLYAPAGYPSMFRYCMDERHWSEDVTCKRLRAARAARKYPAIFAALADGRLHVSGVSLLARHLTRQNASELLTAAVHRTKVEIEQLLAERFPQRDVPARIRAIAHPPAATMTLPAPGPVDVATSPAPGPVDTLISPAPGPVEASVQPAPGPVEVQQAERVTSSAPWPKVTPLSPQRYALQLTMEQSMLDNLRRWQQLTSHQVPSGDLAQVINRALEVAIATVEKRKFGATDKPRPARGSANPRHIPADVKRRVWKRDGGQCTFASNQGQRCAARGHLELDHIEEVARGGKSTASNIRLLCRAHNQYAAECTFGADFMRNKRSDAMGSRETGTASGVGDAGT